MDPLPLKDLTCVSSEGDSCEFGSQKYLILCGFGGILSCGTTHTAVVPLDLVKCRMQVCLFGTAPCSTVAVPHPVVPVFCFFFTPFEEALICMGDLPSSVKCPNYHCVLILVIVIFLFLYFWSDHTCMILH